jgi:hypothetical protein
MADAGEFAGDVCGTPPRRRPTGLTGLTGLTGRAHGVPRPDEAAMTGPCVQPRAPQRRAALSPALTGAPTGRACAPEEQAVNGPENPSGRAATWSEQRPNIWMDYAAVASVPSTASAPSTIRSSLRGPKP